LRWTLKTDVGVTDLDGSAPIELNRYYHVTCLYTGYSMELYVDGTLDAFKPFSGAIQASTKPITLGREDNVETQYNLLGSIDEVKIWDKEISPAQIAQLKYEWLTPTGIIVHDISTRIYPNPSYDFVNVEINAESPIEKVVLYSVNGVVIKNYSIAANEGSINVKIEKQSPGLYLLKIILKDGQQLNKKIVLL
jgi:hypothetical protein